MIPAPSTPSWPGEHGQREHRTERRASVAIPLESPADADERRADRRELLGERSDVGGGHPGDVGRAREPPRVSRRDHLVRAGRVRIDERPVDEVVLREVPHDPENERHIGAGPQRQMPIGSPSHRRASRIDDDESGARSPRLLHERREVDVRDRGVRAPHDDEPAVHDVVRVGREHRPERRLPRRARGRCADRVEDPRGAELVEQAPGEPLRGEQSRGRVVEVGDDRRRARPLRSRPRCGRPRGRAPHPTRRPGTHQCPSGPRAPMASSRARGRTPAGHAASPWRR